MARTDQNIQALRIESIYIPHGRRPVDSETVAQLAASLAEFGLQHPITVRYVEHIHDPEEGDLYDVFALVAGHHRLQAAKSLGWERINCDLVRWTDKQARKWEIIENLHRKELSLEEESKQTAELVQLMAESDDCGKPAQVAPVLGGRGNKGGINEAARELGIERTEIQRAVKLANVSDEAWNEARKAGVAETQSVMLEVARAPIERQTEAVKEIVETREGVKERQPRRLSLTALAQSSALSASADMDLTEFLVSQYYGAGRAFLTRNGTNEMVEAALQQFLATEPTVTDLAAMAQEAGRRAVLKMFDGKWDSFIASLPVPPPKPPAKRRTKQAAKQRRRA